jgi:hypothetical protein
MPSDAGVVQDATILRGVPITSTMQILHAPKGWSLSSLHSVGTRAPAALAASRREEPRGIVTVLLSMVRVGIIGNSGSQNNINPDEHATSLF